MFFCKKMKVNVKILQGLTFEIQVNPDATVADVKKNIETIQGAEICPASQLMLIYRGKVLNDGSTLDENKVVENSFIVAMLNKRKISPGGACTNSAVPPSQAHPANTLPSGVTQSSTPLPALASTTSMPPPAAMAPPVRAAPVPPPPAAITPSVTTADVLSESDTYGQAASNLVAGSGLESTIQRILDLGEGSWDREAVIRALRAAFNNPERAVEYLYSGIPEQPTAPTALGPNANPPHLFPEGLLSTSSNANSGPLDFLRNSQQFRALRAMVRANPDIMEPLLQELGKQNPNIMQLIQAHRAEFMRLINEPAEGDGDMLNQLASAMPRAITVTAEERRAIERLEAMGFDRALVMEVFFACNKNEELAANYLLDHVHEFE